MQSEISRDFLDKIIPIHPLIYENINFDNEGCKDITTIFTLTEARRFNINEKLKTISNYNNIGNIYNKNELLNIYKKSKILVNVHQTDHHHTLEELRILPALMNGVIIVSEVSAFTEYIPYNDFIIWSNYNDLEDTVKDVNNNYNHYYNKIFKNSNLQSILEKMIVYNHEVFQKFIK